MSSPKQKIIQKRVKRRERYARMARIRHRKQKNVMLAQPSTLANIEKCTDQTLVHQYYPGIFIGERDGGIDCEASMLNKSYTSNCITVLKEEELKLLSVKLCKNSTKMNIPGPEELREMECKACPEWPIWAERFRKFSNTFKGFVEKHKTKFTTGRIGDEYTAKYNSYVQKRKEIFATKGCFEIRVRFNALEDYVNEIIYNSKYIENLNYDFEEFVDKILREGIPRVKYTENDNGFLMANMLENFESIFEKPLELAAPKEPRFMGKDQKMLTANVTFSVAGYFIKSKAEISYLIMLEDVKPLPESTCCVKASQIPIVKKEHLDEEERKAFLDKYYRNQNQCNCAHNEYEYSSTPRSETVHSTKIESEDMRIKEEICDENENYYNNNNNTHNNNMNYGCTSSLVTKDENTNFNGHSVETMDNLTRVYPPEASFDMYNTQLQQYLLIWHNSLFNLASQ